MKNPDNKAGVYKRRDELPECAYSDSRIGKCKRSTWGGARGLCGKHYAGALYHVKKGNETWESLEKRGVCRKPLDQIVKNMNQAHPHRTYKRRVSKVEEVPMPEKNPPGTYNGLGQRKDEIQTNVAGTTPETLL